MLNQRQLNVGIYDKEEMMAVVRKEFYIDPVAILENINNQDCKEFFDKTQNISSALDLFTFEYDDINFLVETLHHWLINNRKEVTDQLLTDNWFQNRIYKILSSLFKQKQYDLDDFSESSRELLISICNLLQKDIDKKIAWVCESIEILERNRNLPLFQLNKIVLNPNLEDPKLMLSYEDMQYILRSKLNNLRDHQNIISGSVILAKPEVLRRKAISNITQPVIVEG